MIKVNLIREYHFLVFFVPCYTTLEDFLGRETNTTTEDNVHTEYTPGTNYSYSMLFSFFLPCFLPDTRYGKYAHTYRIILVPILHTGEPDS